MRNSLSTLLALSLALTAASACAADTSSGATARDARRAELQQRFLDKVDANHDGKISRAEYQSWLGARFDTLDANGDGRVDATEVAASPQVAQRVHERADRFVARYDTSGSGSVSKADFESKELARFDRLGGGADPVEAARLMPRRGAFGRRFGGAMPEDNG